MIALDLFEELKDKFSQPLPGKEAQLRMAHPQRQIFPEAGPEAKKASVMLLLYPKDEQLHTVFIKRPEADLRDRHRGQISFPGGRVENSDKSLWNTALREAHEEIGLPQGDVEKIAPLTDLFIPVSNYQVFPFVGITSTVPEFVLQPSEVQAVIETPLSLLQSKQIRQITRVQVNNHLTLHDVPCFDIRGHVVWGATAMILNEFLEVLERY